jgi:gamma-glutamyl-gamma-aminobutyrate hydrolase PuuD
MQKSQPVIGILTQPIEWVIDQPGANPLDQYVQDSYKYFIDANSQAEAVPIRFDLIKDPEKLHQTLDSVNGVLLTGGGLNTRIFS